MSIWSKNWSIVKSAKMAVPREKQSEKGDRVSTQKCRKMISFPDLTTFNKTFILQKNMLAVIVEDVFAGF
jgi:hypothetical protein